MRLGKSSLGLGLYFTSIVLFVLISFVMTLVMLWSVSNNASSDAFEKSYTLRVPEPVVVDAFGAQKTTERAVLCRRSYEVATPITRLSLGSRCMPGNADGNADERTSLLHCPVECRYVNERGNNTKPVLTSEDLADPCTAVPSCDVNKNGGKCCTLTLLTKEVGVVPKGQSWAIFAHTLVLLLLLLVLDWALALTGSNLNANTATVGDFTIFVDQLPIPAEDCPPEEKAVIEGKVRVRRCSSVGLLPCKPRGVVCAPRCLPPLAARSRLPCTNQTCLSLPCAGHPNPRAPAPLTHTPPRGRRTTAQHNSCASC